MKIATWNVNSVRKRTGNLVAWLEQRQARRRRAAGDQGAGGAVPAARGRGRRLQGRDRRPEGLQRRGPALAASGRDHRARPARCRGRRTRALHRRQDHDAQGAADRRRHLPAQRQSHRHREVRLQDRLDGSAEPARAGAAGQARRCSCWAATTMSARPRSTSTIPRPSPTTRSASRSRARRCAPCSISA